MVMLVDSGLQQWANKVGLSNQKMYFIINLIDKIFNKKSNERTHFQFFLQTESTESKHDAPEQVVL